MTIERMCELGQVSRAGLYRFDPDLEPDDQDMDLRDEIQRIALEFPYYGRPRIVRTLRDRGWQVGHPVAGSSWEGLLVENVAAAVVSADPQLWFYRTADGAVYPGKDDHSYDRRTEVRNLLTFLRELSTSEHIRPK